MSGKCPSCLHVRILESDKGSRFFLCELAKVDERFSKYPPQPVIRCAGFVAAPKGRAEQ
jgi:hypothetical protein